VALLAINNAWPDVRVLGCEYVGHHARHPHAAWLMPLFYDANRSVQIAAITAAGKCRNPVILDGTSGARGEQAFRGIRPLLMEAQGRLRFVTVVSMCSVGDPQAMQELIRLGFDSNPTTRLDVALAMGDTGQTRFIEPLIRLAWTEGNQNVKIAAVASLKKLVAPEEHPPGARQAPNLEYALQAWVAWWEARQGRGPDDARVSRPVLTPAPRIDLTGKAPRVSASPIQDGNRL
jgi:hypothetical protein